MNRGPQTIGESERITGGAGHQRKREYRQYFVCLPVRQVHLRGRFAGQRLFYVANHAHNFHPRDLSAGRGAKLQMLPNR